MHFLWNFIFIEHVFDKKNSDYLFQTKGARPVKCVHSCSQTGRLRRMAAMPKLLAFLLFQDIKRNPSLWFFITSG